MKRLILLPMVIFFGIYDSASAEPSQEAVVFLEQKMAEIKGDSPPTISDPDLPPLKCGTPTAVAAFAMHRETPSRRLEALQDRPIDLPLTFPTANFIIHYAASGADAPYQATVDINPADGVPDFVNRAGEIFENVWNVQINTLGFSVPPSDHLQGGDGRYDVYLTNLGFGYFGFTNPESVVQNYRAFSFIEVENDFAESARYRDNPVDGLRVTAAHEFFHAIQFGYDAFEFDADRPNDPTTYKPWWMEATSTWMEEMVYDDIDDYIGYLPFFYRYPWIGLGAFSYGGDVRGFHPYASCVWPIYLTERFDDVTLVREIWQQCGAVQGYNTLPATNASLTTRGSSLAAAFQEFAVWNFHTGPLADQDDFYSEGASFPAMDTTFHIPNLVTSGPINVPNTIQYPEQLAANYIVMDADPEAPGGVVVNFNGQGVAGQDWRAALLGYKSNDSRWEDSEINSSSGDGAAAWLGWNTYRAIVLIPTVTGLNPNNSAFVYIANLAYDPNLEGGGTPIFSIRQGYPSPYVISSDETVNIPYSLDKTYAKKDLGLWIYDASGQMVREIPGEGFLFTDPGEYQRGVIWDGKNDKGEYVASGIYIYLFEAEDKSASGKIAVVNNRQ